MQEKFIGFNTAGMKYDNRFLALMLKTSYQNQPAKIYYLQAQVLVDLLLVLQNRMLGVLQRLATEGDEFKAQIMSTNKALVENIPTVELSELQNPSPARRIMSITHKPAEKHSLLIVALQNEQIETLYIDDMHVEALLVGIQQALVKTDDKEIIEHIGSTLDFLLLYALDLSNTEQVQYQQYMHENWKVNLFTHYLNILFCCETTEGKKIVSGAVIKTSVPNPSDAEKNIAMRLLKISPKLNEVHAQRQPCQIFTQKIAAESGKVLNQEECLNNLKAFYLEKKVQFN